jgi:hypothetical protein
MFRIIVSILVFSVAGQLPDVAHATLITTPNGQSATEGNVNNISPFSIGAVGVNSERYQQVFAATEFSALSGPELITQILFRPDSSTGFAFSSTLPNVQIDLSTTAKAPDSLNASFSSNIGSNDTMVFSGALALSSTNSGPAGGPKDFDIIITLTTPFLYDPAGGNLLLDVRNFGGGSTTNFDAQFSVGDSVSRLYTTSANGVGESAGFADSVGLVAQFVTALPNSVPEPSMLALMPLGLVLLGLTRRRARTIVAASIQHSKMVFPSAQ